jgi:hypothetical protein
VGRCLAAVRRLAGLAWVVMTAQGVLVMNVHRLTGFLGLPVALIVAAGMAVTGAGAAPAARCVNWTGVAPGNPVGSDFAGVAVPSRCSAWAVGSFSSNGHYRTLVKHWNGTRWGFKLSENPGGFTQDNFLTGVAAAPGARPWAVGYYSNGTANQTLAETPKGVGWRQVPTPDPGGPGQDDELFAVAATSARNAWAVGRYTDAQHASQTLILRWNGTAWRRVPSPDPGATGNGLFGVAATSAGNAWAVGQYTDAQHASQTLILRWNGTAWKRVPSPDPGGPAVNDSLRAVAALSASSAWAVGTHSTGGVAQPLIEHWDGTAWKRVPAPTPSSSASAELTGVTAISARDAWAVGDYGSPGRIHTLIEHWDGKAWRRVPSPSPGTSALLRGVASSTASIWAVGGYSSFGGPHHTLAVHCC